MPTRKDFTIEKCKDCIRVTRSDIIGDKHCHLQQYVRKAHSFRCGMDSTKYKDNVYVDIENIHIL